MTLYHKPNHPTPNSVVLSLVHNDNGVVLRKSFPTNANGGGTFNVWGRGSGVGCVDISEVVWGCGMSWFFGCVCFA